MGADVVQIVRHEQDHGQLRGRLVRSQRFDERPDVAVWQAHIGEQ
jgi:hypothetical protein